MAFGSKQVVEACFFGIAKGFDAGFVEGCAFWTVGVEVDRAHISRAGEIIGFDNVGPLKMGDVGFEPRATFVIKEDGFPGKSFHEGVF